MESKSIDAAQFREGQQQQWDKASSAWDKYSDFIDANASHISERLVELAGVTAGSRVLDVACGYGEPALTAARVAGPEGKVVASDISSGMLGYARERAADAGLENMEFVQSDAMSLAFPAGSFDAALSRWGIIFDPDGEGAAARVRSFLEPGCRMAIASWGPPDRVPFLGIPVQTVMKRLDIPPPPPGTPGPLSRPTADAIGGLLEGGGFSNVEVEETQATFKLESAEVYTTWVRELAPPITAMMASHPQEVQDETWQAITAAFADVAADDGSVELTNLVLLASGTA
jgi:ubiquinone/menaquinone biosynthesis C-methylase UbiE